MKSELTIPEISKLLGIDEPIIRWVFSRQDSELAPYLQHLSQKQPGNDENDINTSSDSEVADDSEVAEFLLNLEGLPVLVKKLSYNIPTTDIIENLACQILHLEVLQQENEQLKQENQQLKLENQQLRQKLDQLEMELSEIGNEELSRNGRLKNTISRGLRWFGK